MVLHSSGGKMSTTATTFSSLNTVAPMHSSWGNMSYTWTTFSMRYYLSISHYNMWCCTAQEVKWHHCNNIFNKILFNHQPLQHVVLHNSGGKMSTTATTFSSLNTVAPMDSSWGNMSNTGTTFSMRYYLSISYYNMWCWIAQEIKKSTTIPTFFLLNTVLNNFITL
jgi:hypothetical protein